MTKVAFFVDGHFLFRKVSQFKSFFVDGPGIRAYCLRHLKEHESVYRIFYYDCPPFERSADTPFGKNVNFAETESAKRKKALLESIRETPEMALRLGKISWQNDWVIKPEKLKELIGGKITKFIDNDFSPNFRQKAVDIKIGLDIATITYKKFAGRIVLIAGDSDFTPAAKLARVEGMHITLDPLGNPVSEDLLEHIDVMHCCLDPDNPNDVVNTQRRFFALCKKDI